MVMRVTGWSVNSELNDANCEWLVFARSRCKHAACLRAGRVYVLGGKDANVPLNDFWSYDIGTFIIGTHYVIFVKQSSNISDSSSQFANCCLYSLRTCSPMQRYLSRLTCIRQYLVFSGNTMYLLPTVTHAPGLVADQSRWSDCTVR